MDNKIKLTNNTGTGFSVIHQDNEENISLPSSVFKGSSYLNSVNISKENIFRLGTLIRQNDIDKKGITVFDGIGAKEDDGHSSAENEGTSGVKYYFSTSGDDSNDGLSPDTPWKTFYQFQRKTSSFNPGDVIMFKRGDVWSAENESVESQSNELLGSEGNNIIVTCYGVGPLPKFTGKKNKNGLSWSKHNDVIWKALVDYKPNQKIRNVAIDGILVTGGKDLAHLENYGIIDFFHDESTGYIYVKADPSKHYIEWSDTNNVFTFQGSSSYYTLKYLNPEWCRYTGLYSYKTMKNIVIANNTTGYASEFGILACGDNFKCYNNIVDCGAKLKVGYDYNGATHLSGGYEGIRCWGDKTTTNIEVYNNTIRNFGHANITMNGGTTDEQGYVPFPKMYNNVLDGRELLYGGKFSVQSRVNGIEAFNNIIIGGDRCQLSGTNGVYRNNVFYNKYLSAFHTYNDNGGLVVNTQNGFLNNVIKDNIFFNISGPAINLGISNIAEIDNTLIQRNVFYKTCRDFAVYDDGPSGISIMIKLDVGNNYEYEATNVTLVGNLFIEPDLNKKQIAVCGEHETSNPDVTYTIKEANEALKILTHTFVGNIQLSIEDVIC